SVPEPSTETRVVEGTHPVGAPAHVSRTKTSQVLLVSATTRLDAELLNATNLPERLITGPALPPFAGAPPMPTETSVVVGVHPAGAPAQVSRTNTSSSPLVSPATRLLGAKTTQEHRPPPPL